MMFEILKLRFILRVKVNRIVFLLDGFYWRLAEDGVVYVFSLWRHLINQTFRLITRRFKFTHIFFQTKTVLLSTRWRILHWIFSKMIDTTFLFPNIIIRILTWFWGIYYFHIILSTLVSFLNIIGALIVFFWALW